MGQCSQKNSLQKVPKTISSVTPFQMGKREAGSISVRLAAKSFFLVDGFRALSPIEVRWTDRDR